MRTISLRELHNKTGEWVRRVESGEEIVVTDRGRAVASMISVKYRQPKKAGWKNRKLVPGYADYLKHGKPTSDSTPGISADRTSRDNSIAGIEQ